MGKIIGIGKKTEEILNQMSVRTISELAKLDIYTLLSQSDKSDIERGVLQRNNIHIAVCSRGDVTQTL